MIKRLRWVHKCHLNQLKKRYSDSRDTKLEESMMVLYDLFDVPKPEKTSKKKRNPTETMDINPKRKKYDFQRKWNLKRDVL